MAKPREDDLIDSKPESANFGGVPTESIPVPEPIPYHAPDEERTYSWRWFWISCAIQFPAIPGILYGFREAAFALAYGNPWEMIFHVLVVIGVIALPFITQHARAIKNVVWARRLLGVSIALTIASLLYVLSIARSGVL